MFVGTPTIDTSHVCRGRHPLPYLGRHGGLGILCQVPQELPGPPPPTVAKVLRGLPLLVL